MAKLPGRDGSRRVILEAPTMEEAAQILGIDPATLYRKRKKLGL